MKLGNRTFTAGDKRKYTVDYSVFLAAGVTIASATVTTPDGSVTISGIDYATNPQKLAFFVAGGTLHQPFTVTVSVTDSTSQIVQDVIDYNVVGPTGN